MARLICFIFIFALFLVFIGLNLNNHCDVNLGFNIYENIPVYITGMVSFFLGMLCTIPILITLKKRKPPIPEKEKPGKKKKSHDTQPEEIHKENGPYGID